MAKEENNNSYAYIAIVAIVAIVALVMLLGGYGERSTKVNHDNLVQDSNVGGQAVKTGVRQDERIFVPADITINGFNIKELIQANTRSITVSKNSNVIETYQDNQGNTFEVIDVQGSGEEIMMPLGWLDILLTWGFSTPNYNGGGSGSGASCTSSSQCVGSSALDLLCCNDGVCGECVL